MDVNYHYYVTYTAAVTAGYSPLEAQEIATACRYVDEALNLTSQDEKQIARNNFALPNSGKDRRELQKIATIWPVFHFLPGDDGDILPTLNTELLDSNERLVQDIFGLICKPESTLLEQVVLAARQGMAAAPSQQQALLRAGITMHVLADTFAHQNFVGLPARQINEVTAAYSENNRIFEQVRWVSGIVPEWLHQRVGFLKDREVYSPHGLDSSSYGYLGHGRMGHIPDKPGAVYCYAPAWYNHSLAPQGQVPPGFGHPVYNGFLFKSNPVDFYSGWLQMVNALQYMRNGGQFNRQVAQKVEYFDPQAASYAYHQQHIQAFIQADTDAALPAVWLQLFPGQNPPPYQKPQNPVILHMFEQEAYNHQAVVLGNCPALGSLLDKLQA